MTSVDTTRGFALVDAHVRAGRLPDAEKVCRILLSVDPAHPATLRRLGVLRHMARDYAAAVRLFGASVVAGDSSAQGDLGVALMKAGRLPDALERFSAARALAPQDARVGYNLAMALLAAGRLDDGFRLYEERWRLKGPVPWIGRWDCFWDGQPLKGETLLVHAEQGFGDAIQFARYVPLAAARGARVVLAVPHELRRLMAGLPGCAHILSEGERIPAYAAHVPLMSLPRLFGTGIGDIPADTPYLRVPDAETHENRNGLLRVGLAWAGRGEDPDDVHRSCALALLAPLLATPGVEFHSLQKGPAEEELDRLADGRRVIRHGSALKDFADTAARIATLDLVVGVDTAVVHLAGALGKPCWVLLSADPDWRWMRERADTPWYPATRLFRQASLGVWPPVIAQVADALARLSGMAPRPEPSPETIRS